MDQSPPPPPTTPSSLTGHCRGLRIQSDYSLPLGPLVSQPRPTLLGPSAICTSVLRQDSMAVLIPSLSSNQHWLVCPSLPQAGHSLPKLEEMVDRLAWLCRVPEGLGEDSSSESLSKGTSSGRGSPSAGPGAISRPEPAMEICRHGWGPGSASVAASSSAASTSRSGPVGSGAVSVGFLSDAVCSL